MPNIKHIVAAKNCPEIQMLIFYLSSQISDRNCLIVTKRRSDFYMENEDDPKEGDDSIHMAWCIRL